MDPEERFNPDYYSHLLSSLTINSRTLITELTTLAEKFSQHGTEIVDLIEERIKRCLPQYKLFAMYLMDSVCKNIGNPYNLLFGSRLYRIFTETYLVVTDTPTRQNLINLFKTWTYNKTSLGLELFPGYVIQKIEQFIIKATSISQNNQPNGPKKLTPDMLLREGNCLLQYIILMNNDLERFPQDSNEMKEFMKASNVARNNLISKINIICDNILSSSKQEFESRVLEYQTDLQEIRKLLDEQSFQQQNFMRRLLQELNDPNINLSEELDLSANPRYFNFKKPLEEDKELMLIIEQWGMPIKDSIGLTDTNNKMANGYIPPSDNDNKETPTAPLEGINNSLGMNFGSINFMDSFLGSPKNEVSKSTPEISENSPGDSYDPEHSKMEPASSDKNKRKNSDDIQLAKKVKFDT